MGICRFNTKSVSSTAFDGLTYILSCASGLCSRKRSGLTDYPVFILKKWLRTPGVLEASASSSKRIHSLYKDPNILIKNYDQIE